MGLFDFLSKKKPLEAPAPEPAIVDQQEQPQSAYYDSGLSSNWTAIRSVPFDGEKTAGELGNVIDLFPDHLSLRARAFEASLKSDVIGIITGKFFKYIIANGLKLQAEPNEIVLKSEGINEEMEDFKSLAEARFQIYAQSNNSDYSGMDNLHKKAQDAYKTAFLGGDALIVLRLDEKYNVNVQVIDGQEVANPFFSDNYQSEAIARGNIIKHGIELNKKGQHVAYYVAKDTGSLLVEWERIEARSKSTGRLMAWMIYGSKHRINHHRGIPQITSILEKVEKLDRYTEATVGGAEERAKIVFTVEHSRDSTGENPFVASIKQNMNMETGPDVYGLGEVISKKIASTTGKTTYNMPIGAKLASTATGQENQYPAFFKAVFVQLCAANDIPPEVALQEYNSNYSASRAAINAWGFIIDFYRKDFSDNFYKPFYNLWLETEILRNKIKADGYIEAIYKKNDMAMQAYSNCKFTGPKLPHIDPLKEVKAFREMLGNPAEGIFPLISYDAVAEGLGLGDWVTNYKKWQKEDSIIEKPEPETVPPATPPVK